MSSVADRTEVKSRRVVQRRIANTADYVGEKGCTRVAQISLHIAKIKPETTTTHKQIRMTALEKKKKITASTKLHRIWIKLNYKKTITSNKHTGMRYLSHSLKGAGKVAKLFLKIKVLVT